MTLFYFSYGDILQITMNKEKEMNKMFTESKKYIFENKQKTLFETNSIYELNIYIRENIADELVQYAIIDTMNYIHICYYGYTLMIKK